MTLTNNKNTTGNGNKNVALPNRIFGKVIGKSCSADKPASFLEGIKNDNLAFTHELIIKSAALHFERPGHKVHFAFTHMDFSIGVGNHCCPAKG